MKIIIDGTNTINKGAELMLYSILEQIENKYPESSVIFNDNNPNIQIPKIKTHLHFRKPLRLMLGPYPWVILSRLHLPYSWFTELYPPKHPDLILDASGFRLGDQWNHSEEYLENLEYYYKTVKAQGAKIILLPQAFGPFKTHSGKKSTEILNNYVDLIIAREPTSKKHLKEAGINPGKILHYSDFTIATKGIFPVKYHHVKGSVCIIPNRKMITHTRFTPQDYFGKMESIISLIQESGKQVFLLNHEGNKDLKICKGINRMFDNRLTIITGLDAKEIKGVIGSSYMVISSRYHGIASALNQGVPCLATSWSHKYQLLFEDFNVKDHIIDLNEKPEHTKNKIESLLDPDNHSKLRKHLFIQIKELKSNTERMWKIVWQVAEERNSDIKSITNC